MSRWIKTAGAPRPGALVEFLHGDRCQAAWVLDDQSSRLRLFTATGREIKLPLNRVLPWTGPVYDTQAGRTEMEQRLQEHTARREQLAGEIDILEIWELSQDDVNKAAVDFFAELIWEAPDTDQIAALGRAMLEAKTHFKFQPPMFEVNSRELVEKKTIELEAQRRREQATQAGREAFKALWSAHCSKSKANLENIRPEAAAALRDVLFALLKNPGDTEAAAIFNEAKKGLPDHPCLALILARAWGVVDEHYDPLPAQIGYDLGDCWAARFEDDVQAVRETFDQRKEEALASKAPLTAGLVSIDAATTEDRDDAIAVERLPDGGYRALVALSRPTMGWRFGSALDAEIMSRSTSLYLPESVTHMLPEAVGVNLFSLAEGLPRPILLLDMRIGDAGDLQSVTPRLEWAAIERNMTYEQAERAIAEDPASMLAQAHALAELLRKHRIAHGAVIIDRPDPDISLERAEDGVKVRIDLKPEYPAAALAVSEFMVLANQAAARWGKEHGVPLIHRTQDIHLPDGLAGVWSHPVDIYQVVRHLAPPVAEVEPKPHASVGVDAYSPVSSPLRRYVDFLNMAQIESFLESGQPRLDKESLAGLLPQINARSQEVSQIQRFRPRYWKLLHLRQNLDAQHKAVLVDDSQTFCSFALPQLQIYVRAPKDLLGDKTRLGEERLLRFNRVDPLLNDMRVCEASEFVD
ncbi:MAG: ribonuclease catalytic domain-containing protein [Desulfovibrionaceae bacterium]